MAVQFYELPLPLQNVDTRHTHLRWRKMYTWDNIFHTNTHALRNLTNLFHKETFVVSGGTQAMITLTVLNGIVQSTEISKLDKNDGFDCFDHPQM